MKNIKYILFFIIYCYSIVSNAQSSQVTFGKNRVQYKTFNWKFVSTTNFDVYFSDGGYDNAVLAAKYAELEYQRIIEMIDYSPYNRIKIIIYNSHDDLLQSNIQTPEENPALGGQINFVKSKIEVPFEGNQLEFKRKIAEQITKFLITDMMYGGSIRNTYRNNLFLVLPEWYINGLAAYVARGWSNEMDDYLRDLFSNYKVKNPSAKSFANQTLVGQSVWHFIAESQGKRAIADVLTLTRISRNYEVGISSNYGLKYAAFEKAWRDYYRNNADVTIDSYTLVDAEKAIKQNRNFHDYYQVKSSPDGKLVAYSESIKGRYKVLVRDLKTGRTYHFLSGGYKTVDQEINTKTPLLSWKSDRVLSVIETKGSRIQMTTREISGGYKTKKIFGTFDQVIDFDYADDGNTIVFSAEKEGKSDLFLFNVKQNTIRQISNDLYDETHPVFLKGSTAFVFSSNRNVDSIFAPNVKLSSLQDNTNLFLYDASVSTTKFKRLTDTKFHESAPVGYSANEVAYLQDETGIFNLSILDIKTGVTKQLTNYQQDIHQFDVSYNKNLSFVMLHKCREMLFVNHPVNFAQEVAKPAKTPRRETFNFIENIFNAEINLDSATISEPIQIINEKTKEEILAPTESKTQIGNEEITFDSSQEPETKKQTTTIQSDTVEPKSNDEIDVNNYTFESDNQTPTSNNADDERNQFGNGIKVKSRSEESIKVSDYKPMRPMLNMDNTISTILFDPLRGFGVVAEVGISDMLENHKFNAYIFGKTDIKTSNMWFEYQFLKKRMDFKFKYDKQRIVTNNEVSISQKSGIDRLEVDFSYPLSHFTRISLVPFGLYTSSINLFPATNPDLQNYFVGGRSELVFDNTIKTGINMIEGTRLRLTSDNYWGTKEKNSSFARLEADIRSYKKIHKEIIFATRLSAGTFYGSGAPNYLLGGVDNWVFAPDAVVKDEKSPLYFSQSEVTDTRTFLFNKYVTNLRGFDYSQQYGKSHLLFNAELRIPVVKYFYKGLINSEFLRNFQLVGFYDIGSAWSGTNPFSSENSYNTTIIENGSITAKVINYKNPFLSSFGPGIHTHAFGYYVKFDLAFPIQDYVYKSPRFMLSLGYDF